MDYKKLITDYLKAFNINQAELAKKSNISQSTLSDIINGKIKNPSLELLTKIANGLGISVSNLIDNNEKILPEYIQIAKECQDEGIDPETIRQIKNIIKKNK